MSKQQDKIARVARLAVRGELVSMTCFTSLPLKECYVKQK